MKYEIDNFTLANAKRLKEALKRLVNMEEEQKVATSIIKADKNLLGKVIAGLKKVNEEVKND